MMYRASAGKFLAPIRTKREVIVVGGGHNGLVAAAYLGKAGKDVLVLERRHVLGGAAVTEEIVPGYKFSRASYLAGLLRPSIIKELQLEKYGFEYIARNPSSFTPTRKDHSQYAGKYLMLGSDVEANRQSISQFSDRDAAAYERYEAMLNQMREVIDPLLDGPPPNPFEGGMRERMHALRTIESVVTAGVKNRGALLPMYELLTAPAAHILDRWFESDILKATLATDAVIGSMNGPMDAGSGYVLLHHVMGEAAGVKGVWAYVRGGMGALSGTIAQSAQSVGVEVVKDATVSRILHKNGRACGVEMADGTKLQADTIISNATPYNTFVQMVDQDVWADCRGGTDFVQRIRSADYSCGALKMNLAVDRLPDFTCCRSNADGRPGPQHHGTIHFESSMAEICQAQREAASGTLPTRPVIEMTCPSALDDSLAPPGKHVVQLFVQYSPYKVEKLNLNHNSDNSSKLGGSTSSASAWEDEEFTNRYADQILRIVDEFAPGFSKGVIARDVLTPLELERTFALHQGNIFHGSLALHQLLYMRPAPGFSSHRTPLPGLYLCGAGAHPGGGVTGAPGRNAARVVLSDLGLRMPT